MALYISFCLHDSKVGIDVVVFGLKLFQSYKDEEQFKVMQ